MTVKLVVIYPRPNDIEGFETIYNRDQVPILHSPEHSIRSARS
jgi:hypothetical protein